MSFLWRKTRRGVSLISKTKLYVNDCRYDVETFHCLKCNNMFEVNSIYWGGTYNNELYSSPVYKICFCPFCGESLK